MKVALRRELARLDAADGVTLIRLGGSAWDDALQAVPASVFHGAGYHRYSRGYGEGEPYLAVVGDRVRGLAWPYILRPITDLPWLAGSGATDVHSVYGYPGPLAWGHAPGDGFVAWALGQVGETWRRQGAVSAFTRFNPVLDNAGLVRDLASDDGWITPAGVKAAGATVSVDLTLDQDLVRAQYGRDLARSIAALRRHGLVTVHDEWWDHLSTFADLYRNTMTRIGAADFYWFQERDFERLRADVGDHLHLLVTTLDDVVVAAGLFLEHDGVVEWHLVGSNDRFRDLSPSKLLVDDAIQWSRERGNRVLHLGGGRGGREDSLYWFKSRFSPQRHQFSTGRWILEPDRYAAFTAARQAALPSGASSDPDFFPAYRAPVRPDGAS